MASQSLRSSLKSSRKRSSFPSISTRKKLKRNCRVFGSFFRKLPQALDPAWCGEDAGSVCAIDDDAADRRCSRWRPLVRVFSRARKKAVWRSADRRFWPPPDVRQGRRVLRPKSSVPSVFRLALCGRARKGQASYIRRPTSKPPVLKPQADRPHDARQMVLRELTRSPTDADRPSCPEPP